MRRVVTICLCIIWMGFIFYNSSNNGESSEEKSHYLLSLLKGKTDSTQAVSKSIDKNITISTSVKLNQKDENLNTILRKNAHAFEYLVLAILVSACLFSFSLKGKNAVIYIMFICLFYAVTDEFHQKFVPGRTSLVSDVLIDFGGSIIGIFIFYLFHYKIYKKFGSKMLLFFILR